MSKTTKTISYIAVILMVSKLFGFVREMTIAAYYGASWQTDAFNMAGSIISLSVVVISMSVSTVIVPMYNHKLVQRGKEEADNFAGNILCIVSLAYGSVSALGMIFAPVLIRVLAPDFNAEASALAVRLIRIIFIFTLGTNAVNFLGAISRANKKYIVPALTGFPLSVITIIFVTLFSKCMGIYALVISYLISILVQVIMLAISLRKTFRFKPALNFTNGDAKEIIILCLPLLISIGVDEINGIVDRILASGLSEGNISAMSYAKKLNALPHGIITSSIITVIFPMFSQYAAKNEFHRVKSLIVKSTSLLFLILTPIMIIFIYYSEEIVKTVYERGVFTREDTLLTARILIFIVLSLFFAGGNGVLNNAFYGMQDTKTPRLGAVIAVGSNIILNLILVQYMQAAGLALATSISAVLNYAVLLIFFRRKYGSFGGLELARNIGKCAVAASSILPAFWLCEFLRGTLPMLIVFCIAVIFGFTSYVAALYSLKADIFMFGLEKARKFLLIRTNRKDN